MRAHVPNRKLLPFAAALALCACLLLGLGFSLQVCAQAPLNMLRIRSPEPGTIDPAVASYQSQVQMAAQIFEGLVRLDSSFEPQPALASGWTRSPDASVYTFTLREAYFSNGRRVVADDVVWSLMRELSPTVGSEYASMLYDIAGAQEYGSGTVTASVGIHALDAARVRLELVGTVPPGSFLKRLSLWVASVLPREEVGAGGPEWWRDPAHCVGSGPFKLAEWVPGDHITLLANPSYHQGRPPLDGIYVRFIDDANAALAAYEAGELDVYEPPTWQLAGIQADPVLAHDLVTRTGTGTYYATMDNAQAPFSGSSGLKLRQAFSHAVDRQAFIDAALAGVGTPAKGLLPPGMYGYNPGLVGLDYDPLAAQQCLADSGYAGAPQIVLYSTLGTLGRAQALAGQLSANLGVDIAITTDSAASYQMLIMGWMADYPDPDNWLPLLLHSRGSVNRTHYNNPTFDALVDEAGHTVTESERLALYQQAEQLAVSEAAGLWLWHDRFLLLTKPRVVGPLAFDWQYAHPFYDVQVVVRRVYLPIALRN